MHPDDPAVRAYPVRLDDAAPTLFAVVDTEEEFDWHAPFSRANTSVKAMGEIRRAQRVFDRFGVVPTYVVSYPVARQPAGVDPLKEALVDGRATIGAHLHPWVTPPFLEPVTARHSYASNLPADLESAKLGMLVEAVARAFGVAATVYKAGRYALAPRTLEALVRLGITVDVSVLPHMDFSGSAGPDFSRFDARPRWMARGRILEIPCTVGYVGAAGEWLGAALHRRASSAPWSRLRAVGALARMRLVNRIRLSPEGNTIEEMKRLTRALLVRGLRTFTLTFHSPSVAPGHTPYVRTAADAERFLATIDRYCDFFFGELGGTTCTPQAFRASLLAGEVN